MSRFGWFFVLVAILLAAVPFAASKSVAESNVTLAVMLNGEICEMDIEEYTLRVLIAEGQKCENIETKKALAVAVRSCGMYFALYGMKHDSYDACDNRDCCLPLGDPKKAEGEFLSELSNAVHETSGIILTLERFPAMALFTLCASQGTRYCEEFSYLTPTENGGKCAEHITVCEFTKEEFMQRLPNAESLEHVIVYGENGKCEFAVFGNKKIDADELVSAFSLPSYEFTLELSENSAIFTCYGAGHGCGLDLCAADKQAENGVGYEKLLLIYYPNLEINKIYNA